MSETPGTAAGSVDQPATDFTAAAPTDGPTDGPTAAAPTDGPTAAAPTDGPTAAAPTDGPTAAAPTDGPTAATQSSLTQSGPGAPPVDTHASATPALGWRAQVGIILWLQRRLLANGLRRGRRSAIAHLFGLALIVLISVPYIFGASIGLGFYLHTASPERAGALLALGATFAMFIWLASPASSQQMFEAPNLPRLLHLPLGLPAMVTGSLLASALSLVTVFTVPFLVAICVGASRDAVSFGQLALACTAMLIMLIVLRAVVGGLFDLFAEDRRTRGRLMLLVAVPILVLYLNQMGLQNMGRSDMVPFTEALARPGLSRWLPSGWFGGAVQGVIAGAVRPWLGALLGLTALAAVGVALHVRLQERLYLGDIARAGPTGVRPTGRLRDRRRIPGLSADDSVALRALLAKDWHNLRRSPMTPRMAMVPVIFSFMTFFVARNTGAPALAVAIGAGGVSAFSVAPLAINAIALLDHRGLVALLLSPVPRRLILLSHGLVHLAMAAIVAMGLGIVVSVATRDPIGLIVTPAVAVASQLCFNGLAHASSVFLPYAVDLERGRTSANETSLLVAAVLMVGMPIVVMPMYVILAATWFIARPMLPLGIAGAILYATAVYWVCLAGVAHAFPGREEHLLEVVGESR